MAAQAVSIASGSRVAILGAVTVNAQHKPPRPLGINNGDIDAKARLSDPGLDVVALGAEGARNIFLDQTRFATHLAAPQIETTRLSECQK